MNYEQKLRELVAADERLVVMTAENRAAIRNLPQELGDRFIDTGITEQTMVGAAAGLALRGRIPVLHALAAFLTMRAFEFVRTDAGIPRLPVKLVGGVPGFLSDGNGPTHQAIEDVSLMRGIPGMQVFCPADEADLVLGLPAFLKSPAPVYIRHIGRPAVTEHRPDFEIGKAEVLSQGEDLTIATYGFMVGECLQAASLLRDKGWSVRLLNMRSLKPVDQAALLSAVRETRLVVTVEDHFLSGGLYTVLAETCLRHQVSAPVLPFALSERWFKPGRLEDLMYYEGFTAAQIAGKIHARMNSLHGQRSGRKPANGVLAAKS
ncbi:MAG: transketolase [Calditrichaeota bacterium]|nr:transketolase [Calditrichota bacterium]HQU72045.1 transketolase C-terminal domain-containing protein [Calditrichia bacterium]